MNCALRNFKIIICLLLALQAQMVAAQAPQLDSLVQKFDQYSQQAFQEKIYLHIDRAFYMTGEILWFKVYNTDGILHHPLSLSKVAYVEVLDAANHPVLQGKTALEKGMGNGSFYLPVVLTSGNYKIRAYTQWMKNFSPDLYFEQPITIVNPFSKLGLPAVASARDYDIQFFPEGGNLVDGIKSKIGFKAVDEKGKSIDFRGVIINQHDDTLVHFSPLKFGMGNFSFTPAAQEQYKAVVTIADSSFIKTLPKALPQGYVMQVSEVNNDQLSVNVQAKTGEDLPFVYLLVHTHQLLKVAQIITLKAGKATVKIDKQSLGKGISHFTLFNSQQQPVCERLYFQSPNKALGIEASTSQPQYGPRENVTVDIHTQIADEAPIPANLSMSVYQADSLALFDPVDMRTYFWLTSDLKGGIEAPEYYLHNSTAETRKAMDNLMLTQGWRRFDWKKILTEKSEKFTFLPEHEGAIITAKVTDKTAGAPAAGTRVYLSVPALNFQFYSSGTTREGYVHFFTKNIYGATPLLVQTNTAKDSVFRYEILSPYSDQYSAGHATAPGFDLSESIKQQIQQRSRNMQVQNVYLEDTLNTFYTPLVNTLPFYGTPDRTFLLDDYTRFPTMEEVMREYVQGVAVRKQKGKFHYKIFYPRTESFFDEDPLILLDGMPIFDTDKAIKMDPLKIKKLEVVKQNFILGRESFSGILSYTTYDHDLSWYPTDPLALQVAYEGLQLQREFYTPKYETEQQTGSRLPDFRTLLHWAPNVITKDGKTRVSFYTSDQQGTYIGIIQGMTEEGEMGSTTFSFEVKGELMH